MGGGNLVGTLAADKPEQITIMCQELYTGRAPRVPKEEDYDTKAEYDDAMENYLLQKEKYDQDRQKYYDSIAAAFGIDIKWIVTSNNEQIFYEELENAFASDDVPDVVILPEEGYNYYASEGKLWDMTSVWENTTRQELLDSDRFMMSGEEFIDSLYTFGPDGARRLYGFCPNNIDGYVIYVNKGWMTAAGYNEAEIADMQSRKLSYDEYYDMLTKMQKAKGHGPLAPGDFGNLYPQGVYWSDFVLNAERNFYYDEGSKEYLDGFAQDAMKEALERTKHALDTDIIDIDYALNAQWERMKADDASLQQEEDDAVADAIVAGKSAEEAIIEIRDNYVSMNTKTARECFMNGDTGVLMYWCAWQSTLEEGLADNVGDEMIVLEPLKEMGKYISWYGETRWCITSSAKNPEGIYKYLIAPMCDGGEVQSALAKVRENAGAGTNIVDTRRIIAEFLPGTTGAADYEAISDNMKNLMNWYKNPDRSEYLERIPATEIYLKNVSDVYDARNNAINAYLFDDVSYEDAMDKYNQEAGSIVSQIITSMNERRSSIWEIKFDDETDLKGVEIKEKINILNDRGKLIKVSDLSLVLANATEDVKAALSDKMNEEVTGFAEENSLSSNDNVKYLDLTLEDVVHNVPVQLNSGKLGITIKRDSNYNVADYNVRVFHYDVKTQTLEERKVDISDDGDVVFEADGFSPYIVYYESNAGVQNDVETTTPQDVQEESPKTGDNSLALIYMLVAAFSACIVLADILISRRKTD